jgi:hypothetical protein
MAVKSCPPNCFAAATGADSTRRVLTRDLPILRMKFSSSRSLNGRVKVTNCPSPAGERSTRAR